MSQTSLAKRFEAVVTKVTNDAQDQEIDKMSFQQLEEQQIRFGQAKLGQTFKQVVTEDGRYCQWFLNRYGDSQKAEHRVFTRFLTLWIERQELVNDREPVTDSTTMLKAKAKCKAMPKGPAESVIDLEEEELWDTISSTPPVFAPSLENQNAHRINNIEMLLGQIVSQLQTLTVPSVPEDQ